MSIYDKKGSRASFVLSVPREWKQLASLCRLVVNVLLQITMYQYRMYSCTDLTGTALLLTGRVPV